LRVNPRAQGRRVNSKLWGIALVTKPNLQVR
jgi:hypothetical protein